MKVLGVGGPAVTSEKRGWLLGGERFESESKRGVTIRLGLEFDEGGADKCGRIGGFGQTWEC